MNRDLLVVSIGIRSCRYTTTHTDRRNTIRHSGPASGSTPGTPMWDIGYNMCATTARSQYLEGRQDSRCRGCSRASWRSCRRHQCSPCKGKHGHEE